MAETFAANLKKVGDHSAKVLLAAGSLIAASMTIVVLIAIVLIGTLQGMSPVELLSASWSHALVLAGLIFSVYAFAALCVELCARGCGLHTVYLFYQRCKSMVEYLLVTLLRWIGHALRLSRTDGSDTAVRDLPLGQWIPDHLQNRTNVHRAPNLAGFVPLIE